MDDHPEEILTKFPASKFWSGPKVLGTQAKNFKGKFWVQLGICPGRQQGKGKRSNFKVKTLRKVLQLLSALFLDEMGIKIPSSQLL